MANGRTDQVNAFVTNLTNGVAAVDTEITVDGVPAIPAPYYLTLDPLNPEREYVLVTAVNGLVLTVTRGLAGTGSQIHVAGEPVIVAPSAQHFEDIWDVLDGLGGAIDHNALSNVTASQHHTKYTDSEAITATDGVYLKLSGGTLTGPIDMGGNDITNPGDIPGYATDEEVGAIALDYLALAGGTMTGFLLLHSSPSLDLHAVPKQYVDAEILAAVPGSLFSFVLDPTITDSDPGPGLLRRNDANPAAVTFLYIDNVSDAGVEVGEELLSAKAGAIIYLQNFQATAVESYHMNGDAIDGVGYTKFPVTFDQSTGTIGAGEDVIIKTFGGAVADAYLRLDGGSTPTTDIPWGDNKITGLQDGSALTDAATVGNVTTDIATHDSIVDAHHAKYTDGEALAVNTGLWLPIGGGSLTGFLTLHADPIELLEAATKQYVDTSVGFSGLHCDLTDILPDDHHARYTDIEAVAAVGALNLDLSYLRLDATNDPQLRFDVALEGSGEGVGFDGNIGTYLSVADLNELDGDSAHIHNSVGGWGSTSNSGAPTQSNALIPKIGGFHAQAIAGTDGTLMAQQVIPLEDILVTPGSDMSMGAWVASDLAMEIRVGITYHTVAGGWVGGTYSAYMDVTPNTWLWIPFTDVIPATTENIRARIQMRQQSGVNVVGGELLFWDGVTIVRGSGAPTQTIPSLRVATPVEVKEPGDITVVFPDADQLKVGSSWAGTGVRYERRDGVGGPVVAEFLSSEAIIAIDASQDEYVGADGRTWNLFGNLTTATGVTTSPVATLADIAGGGEPVSHDELLGITASDHHTRYTDAEAISAVGPSVEEAPTDGGTYGRKNTGWIAVGDSGFDGQHGSLGGVTSSQHHVRYSPTPVGWHGDGQGVPESQSVGLDRVSTNRFRL